MLPRFHVEDLPGLGSGDEVTLSESVSRHVQVLRMQPGDAITVFDGLGAERQATVVEMGRKRVTLRLGEPVASDRELPVEVTLAVGMPANDRMDFVIEKATELGARVIQPLVCERSVLRLEGDRAAKKVAHWQGVAIAAAEQCGRAVVPRVMAVQTLAGWLRAEAGLGMQGASAAQAPCVGGSARRAVLSLRDAVPLTAWLEHASASARAEAASEAGAMSPPGFVFLNGPEGGLSPAEEEMALRAGWQAVSLGRRVLRADTAPLAALSVIAALHER